MPRSTQKHNVERRREEGAIRASHRDKLSPTQQLEALDQRLGMGIGAEKERARLDARIRRAQLEQELAERKANRRKEKKK